MDILEFAMQMELDGRNFYLGLADKAEDAGVRQILEMLARDEMKHYTVLEELKVKEPKMIDTDILSSAKNVFNEMKDKGEEKTFPSVQIDLYKKAQEIEQKSRNFYLDKAKEIKKEYEKGLFNRLAEEEMQHYILLDNIIGYVSKPKTWLENAEWYHLDEY
jgi:rubrerythrin